MGIIVDILIVGLFAFYIHKNKKTTQLRCALETVCYIISIALSTPIAIKLSQLAYDSFFRAAIAKKLDKIVSVGSHAYFSSGYNVVMQQMPSMVKNAAPSYGIMTQENVDRVNTLVRTGSNTSALDITDIVAKPVIQGVFRAVFFIILFFAFLFLLKALAATFENLLYTPDRVTINTALCGAFGAFKAIVVLVFSITVIQFMLPAIWSTSLETTSIFSSSFLFRLFYHNNVVMLFLGKGIYPVAM